MSEHVKLKRQKLLLLALKTAIGGSAAIYIAEKIGLQFAPSAGIIAMLSLVSTKWGTLKLSLLRVLTFLMSVALCWGIFHLMSGKWIEFGIFLFFLILICDKLGCRNTISVNAVIGTHFLATQDFSAAFIFDEFLLVGIGITIAIILNLFHINGSHEQDIIQSMRHVERQMREILEELAGYLKQQVIGEHVWRDISALEKDLEEFVEQAVEYQNNTFHSHPSYYIYYFEMRLKQCGVLQSLHAEMQKIRNLPRQADIISDYIKEVKKHVTEMNDPKLQMKQLERVLEQMKEHTLPRNFEEFENEAKLYHIMMDLEEFLMYKKRFIESIDAKQFRIYWKREIEGQSIKESR